MFCQKNDVVTSIPEGRKVHIDHIEPIEEIFSKTTFTDFYGEIPIGRRDDSDIDFNLFLSADPTNHTFLNHTE